MPVKISFFVTSCTGSDDNFGPQSLETPSPLSKGWKTPRFCPYPQQLTVQFNLRAVRIRKIQILCHQYMIPTRIDIAIAPPLPANQKNITDVSWKKLGFSSFASNEQTSFKQRELKSVLVDVVAGYVRLIVHKNHINHDNLFNQVSIVALNVLGDDVSHVIGQPGRFGLAHDLLTGDRVDTGGVHITDPNRTQEQRIEDVINSFLPHGPSGMPSTTDQQLWGSINQPTVPSSITDDLSFGMYQDPKMAHLIRKLEEKKNNAVSMENYQHAKLLKEAIQDMQKYGERMGRLEAEKLRAVENEDFDMAIQKKAEKQDMAMQAKECLEIHHIVITDDLFGDADPAKRKRSLSPTSVAAEWRQQAENMMKTDHVKEPSSPPAEPRRPRQRIPPVRLATPPPMAFGPVPGVDPNAPFTIDLPSPPSPNRPSPPQYTKQAQQPSTRFSSEFGVSKHVRYSPSTSTRYSPSTSTSALPPLKRDSPTTKEIFSRTQEPPTATDRRSPTKAKVGKNHDDQILPSLAPAAGDTSHAATRETEDADQTGGGGGGGRERNDDGPAVLSAKMVLQYDSSISVFSQAVVQNILSKTFSHRAEGLAKASARLLDSGHPVSADHSSTAIARATAQILDITLKDRVFIVLQNAITLLMHTVKTISSSRPDVNHLVQKSFSLLLPRMGDQAPRIASLAKEAVMELSASPIVKPLNIICPIAMEPMKKSNLSLWQLYKGRIDLLGDLLKQDGLKCGLTVSGMMKFVQPAMEHRRGAVRDATTKLVIMMYTKFGQDVRKHLPEDNAVIRKNPFFKNIFTEFDRIDGKPTKADIKAKADAEEKAKNDQIRQLQEQMEMLKALQRGEIPDGAAAATPSPRKGPTQPPEPTTDASPNKPKTSQLAKKETPVPAGGNSAVKRRVNQTKHQRNEALKDRITRCVFCEIPQKDGEGEQEKHYCSHCPMLTSCPGCTQVVEVSNLASHLLSECPHHSSYKKCQRCKQAVAGSDMAQHTTSNACPKHVSGMTCCPLCTSAIHDNDKSWRYHLMKVCANNPRKTEQDVSPGNKPRPAVAAAPLSRPPSYAPTVASATGNLTPSRASSSKIPTLAARSPRLHQ